MEFFCPACQTVTQLEPEQTITTKLGQTAYKAHCSVCNQDMASILPPHLTPEPQTVQTPTTS